MTELEPLCGEVVTAPDLPSQDGVNKVCRLEKTAAIRGIVRALICNINPDPFDIRLQRGQVASGVNSILW